MEVLGVSVHFTQEGYRAGFTRSTRASVLAHPPALSLSLVQSHGRPRGNGGHSCMNVTRFKDGGPGVRDSGRRALYRVNLGGVILQLRNSAEGMFLVLFFCHIYFIQSHFK